MKPKEISFSEIESKIFLVQGQKVLQHQEVARLISQVAISKTGRGGRRKPAMAFTEQGVAMLSSVLNSDRAIDVNIAIMRTFVKLREVLELDRRFEKKLTALEAKCDGKFQLVFRAIRDLMSKDAIPRKRVLGLDNQQ